MITQLMIKNFIKDNIRIHIVDLILKSGMQTGNHTHDFYEFFIVLKGDFEEVHNNKRIVIKERTIHLIKPTDSHFFIAGGISEVNILRNIAIEKNYFLELISKSGISEKINIFSHNYIDETVFSEFIRKSQLLLDRILDINIEYVFENIFSDILINIVNKYMSETLPPNWLIKAHKEMGKKENLVDGLNKFIELSGKSQEHLTREFRKFYNETPTDYINWLRLLEASKLLIQTNDNITDIVFKCGFGNISYFNRTFKRKYNLTPKKYREINKGIFNFTSI